jgi:hypothetical protein
VNNRYVRRPNVSVPLAVLLIGKMDPKNELLGLGNDLACLLYYPVGPRFDESKETLPKAHLLSQLNKGLTPGENLHHRNGTGGITANRSQAH